MSAPACDAPASEILAALLRRQSDAIAAHLNTLMTSDDPEGPHKLRVALRRLRGGLRAFKPILRKKQRRALARNARALGRAAAPLRDADVLIEDWLAPQTMDADALRDVRAKRDAIRDQVRAALTDLNAQDVAAQLKGLAESGAWRKRSKRAAARAEAPARDLLAKALNRAWASIAPRGDRLVALSDADRHELRKDLKTLRYIAELHPASTDAPFMRALRRVQNRLGDLNDLRTLAHAAATYEGAIAEALTAQFDGEARERWLASAARRWAALAAAELFWRSS
ncbi:MAG: CHAD domain-containing protein [Alphaproteobacteria bacterium]|nr:CHAD domain-containing protein [Alphaproteobacteria bacterium]